MSKKHNKNNLTRGERMKQIDGEHTEICGKHKQFVYKTRSGDEHRECRGSYNSHLTRAITHDLAHLSIFFADIRGAVIEATIKVNQLDDNLMRMLDDRKGGRDLISFDYDGVADLIHKISTIKPANIENKAVSDEIRDLLIMCVMRISYMAKWANYLETLERIEQFEFDSTIQMFDSNGTKQLEGLSDKEIEEIRTLIDFEKKFLLLYLKAEPDSKGEKMAYEEALKMELMAKLVAENKVEEFLKEHGLQTDSL